MCSLDTSYGSLDQDLLEVEDALRKTYKVDAIVNCTGLARGDLAKDELVYPLRGDLLTIANDGTRFPVLNQCLGERPLKTWLGRETRLKDGNPSAIVHNYGHGGAGFALLVAQRT
ncbi:hypothetical protein SELMODRAFT_413286 [Selaginella moellendorffii]|uniref:FAD dependent oxidoreductase domain-containing protein n=1 Tax=Selaginella moellendorffii TaxID=88036 RepID=D8RNZ0_SELML|nr:hypothetical protein SELMODRAFT_413286 [Selaginella moellendorffii]